MDLAIHLGITKNSLHHTFFRLKLKGLIVMKEKSGHSIVYKFKRSALD